MSQLFDWSILSQKDWLLFANYVGSYRDPDLVICPDGKPYLYRWHIFPHGGPSNCYFHIQVADDPERPLHNHPWDNMSVILSGGYKETLCAAEEGPPWPSLTKVYYRKAGDVVFRKSGQAHRLEMGEGVPYTMTLFFTGPKVRKWGFWYPGGFVPYDQVTRTEDGKSVHIKPTGGM